MCRVSEREQREGINRALTHPLNEYAQPHREILIKYRK